MENSKLLTILVQVDEGIKTPFKAYNEILSLNVVFSSYSEKQVDDAYDKGFKDGCKIDRQ